MCLNLRTVTTTSFKENKINKKTRCSNSWSRPMVLMAIGLLPDTYIGVVAIFLFVEIHYYLWPRYGMISTVHNSIYCVCEQPLPSKKKAWQSLRSPNLQIPECTCSISYTALFQNRNGHISVLNGALWDMELVPSWICVIGLLSVVVVRFHNHTWRMVYWQDLSISLMVTIQGVFYLLMFKMPFMIYL